MDLYAILRRRAWQTPEELGEADGRSRGAREKPGAGLRHVRSYVLGEQDGSLGTICFYLAESPDAILRHARAADLPADEVVKVDGVFVSEPDPEPAGQGQG
ncbi:MAG: DUF4242 domain-containing protein [Actinomycetota bacterium]|nr:DUF4242 domain-containing protein [Actinomycetota bacterium]